MLIPSKIEDIFVEWNIRLNKIIFKLILSFFLLFFNVATIKFKITCMLHYISIGHLVQTQSSEWGGF